MLEAKNIHKVYNNGNKSVTVLKGVDLSLERGKFAALVGPSGAGKSTLLNILGGLDSPSRGKVFFNGTDIYALSDAELSRTRNKRVGFIFQFYHLLSEFTVLENVMMPALISPQLAAPSTQIEERARALLDKVGLARHLGHFPAQLSGGEQQRVAIARGLINNPGLLLCDEPTGNLDSQTGQEIISLIKEVCLENKMTVVLVTHNLELARSCEAVYHLRDGILVN